MKIAIINVMAPFIYGGAEFMADSLCKKFIEYGHAAQVIRFYYSWAKPEYILDGIFAARAMWLDNVDRVVALKFPAYLIPHPDKRLWLVHQLRQAYELENTEYDFFQKNDHDQKIKAAIRRCDTRYLKELEGNIFTNSKVVSDRLLKYNGISSQVLYPPLIDEELYKMGDYGDYIFYPSRVNRSKRQYLAVEAMRYVKSDVKLVIAGKGDSPKDESDLFALIENYQLKDRVVYINRFISQEEKTDLFKDALASIYIPYDEDSYGYVTLEAFQAGKAVITATDCGGTSLVVKDSITGYMTQPTPQSIAEAMDQMYLNRNKTKEMGMNGLPFLRDLGISWENVVARFTE